MRTENAAVLPDADSACCTSCLTRRANITIVLCVMMSMFSALTVRSFAQQQQCCGGGEPAPAITLPRPASLSRAVALSAKKASLPFVYALSPALALPLQAALGQVAGLHLGDVDDDNIVTVRDIALVVEHVKGTTALSESKAVLADVTKDGAVNQADVDEMIKEVLETRSPEALPLSTLRFTSPAAGEGDVSVNRETIVHFTVPLAINATLDTTKFYAEFAGRKVISRVEIASDRKKASLFHLEPLPANSRVKVTFDGSALTDIIGRPFDSDGDGVEGGVYYSTFDTVTITAIPATGVTGRVIKAAAAGVAFAGDANAGGDEGIPGVTIAVDGAEETLRAVTNAQGYFTLNPCPTGTFFVHIDGRTSPQSHYPNGDYFPSVGKQWEAIAGKSDNPAGGTGIIHLPHISPATLKPVSQTQETVITFPPGVIAANPQLAGTEFRVPANSLFADDGTRGGLTGIAPVPFDRLPSPLPPNLRLPFVFTMQTDGPGNFERPVAVTLPNLPDPLTGRKPEPGEKCALVSFNHDTGQWEVAGSMTVTADGKFMKTDPGVGLRQPGWGGGTPGGTAPGVQGSASPPAWKPCDNELIPYGRGIEQTPNVLGGFGDIAGIASGVGLGGNLVKGTAIIADGVEAIVDPTAGNISENVANAAEEITDKGSFWNRGASGFGLYMDLSGLGDRIKKYKEVDKKYDEVMERCFGLAHREASLGLAPGTLTNAYKAAENAANAYNEELGVQQPIIAPVIDAMNRAEPLAQRLADQPGVDPRAVLTPNELADFADAMQTMSVGARSLSERTPLPMLALTYLQKSTNISRVMEIVYNNPEFAYPVRRMFWRLQFSSGELRFASQAGQLPQPILPPQSLMVVTVYQPDDNLVASDIVLTPATGGRFDFPKMLFRKDRGSDADNDGVSDVAEGVIGTSITNRDTDNDGTNDGAELRNGSDPLSGLAVSTGVIASAPLAASAGSAANCIDLAVGTDVLAAACSAGGVHLLGIRQGLTPTRLAQVPTAPDSANMVAVSGNLVAAGLGSAGTMIVDISSPEDPLILRRIKLGSTVRALAMVEGSVFIGLEDGRIAQCDMLTGRLIASTNLGAPAHDLAAGRGVLYAATSSSLKTVALTATGFGAVTSVAHSGAVPNTGRFRVYKGTDRLYLTHRTGMTSFNIASPAAPVLMEHVATAALGWSHFVPTGSNLAVACLGANNPDEVSLYNLGPNGAQANFLTTFATPGAATSAAVYNGLAYIADGTAGVQVVNFRAFDTLKVPPIVTLAAEALNSRVEEGKFIPVIATAMDDVLVRNVEFYVDGVKVETDGNFPFESRVLAPRLAPGKTSVVLRARASDTGGNTVWSNEITLTLTADASPPSVLAFSPGNGALLSTCSGFTVKFSEPMDRATLSNETVRCSAAGPDGYTGTDDDVAVPVTLIAAAGDSGAWRETASFQTNTPLAAGAYRVLLTLGIKDSAGNPLVAPHLTTFIVIGAADEDNDGLPDNIEAALGYSTESQDSNGNGIIDGLEDSDGDGLSNAAEIRYGLQPNNPDSNGDGIRDDLEDADKDTLTVAQEIAAGSDPTKADTDGDGWPDQVEVEYHSNAADARSKPLSLFVGTPAVTAAILGSKGHVASPPVSAVIVGGGSYIAPPPATITIIGGGTNVASPPLNMRIENPQP